MYPTHHALLYIGLDSFNSKHYTQLYQDTHDIIIQRYNEFRINDARDLVRLATLKPIYKDKQTFVIKSNTIATEAQNALLKLLEDPPTASFFVFILPENTLIPTLLSRFLLVKTPSSEANQSLDFSNFLSQSVVLRLATIVKLIEQKAVTDWLELRFGLINYLNQAKEKLNITNLTKLNWLCSQLNKRGSSNKLLWEEIALILPVEV